MDVPAGFKPMSPRLANPGFKAANPHAQKAEVIARHEKRDRSAIRALWLKQEKAGYKREGKEAPKRARPQCAGTGKDGSSCGTIPKHGEDFCRWHKPEAEVS